MFVYNPKLSVLFVFFFFWYKHLSTSLGRSRLLLLLLFGQFRLRTSNWKERMKYGWGKNGKEKDTDSRFYITHARFWPYESRFFYFSARLSIFFLAFSNWIQRPSESDGCIWWEANANFCNFYSCLCVCVCVLVRLVRWRLWAVKSCRRKFSNFLLK